jgi:hypothetical protein
MEDLFGNEEVDLGTLGTTQVENPKSEKQINKDAVNASIISGKPIAQVVKQEYETTGESLSYDTIVAEATDKTQGVLVNATNQVLLELDDSVIAEELVKSLRATQQKATNPDVLAISELKRKSTALAKLEAYDPVLAIKEQLDLEQQTLALVSKGFSEMSYGEIALELAGLILPPDLVTNPILGDNEGDVLNYVQGGDFRVSMTKHLNSLSLEERKVYLRDVVGKNFKDYYDATGMNLAPMIFGTDIFDPEYEDSWWETLDDVVTGLETVPLVGYLASGVAKVAKTVKAASKVVNIDTVERDSMLAKLEAVAPEKANAVFEQALETPEVSKVLTGVESTEAYLSKIYPNTYNSNTSTDVSWLAEEMVNSYVLQEKAFLRSQGLGGINLSTKEQKAQMDAMKGRVEGVKTAHPKTVTTLVDESGNGMLVKVLIGEKEQGFATKEEAILAAKQSFAHLGVDERNLTVFSRDPSTGGRYKPLDGREEVPEKSYYQVEVNLYKDWGTENLTPYSVKDVALGALQEVAGYIVSPIQRFNKHITRSMNLAENYGVKTSAHLVGILEPYTKLSRKSADKVGKILINGSDAEIRYTPQELTRAISGEGLKLKDGSRVNISKEEAMAIQSHYIFADTLHMVNNRVMAKDKANRGYWKYSDNNSNDFFVKPTEFRTGVRVFNPETDEYINLTKDNLEALQKEGYSLGKLDSPVMEGKVPVDHIIARTKNDNTFRAVKETDSILAYKPGYVSRKYTGDHFVYKVTSVPRGEGKFETVTETVGNVGTKKEGEALATKLQGAKGGEYVRYVTKPSSESLTAEGLEDFSIFDGINSSGRSFQRHRGQRLMGYEDDAATPYAAVQDVTEVALQNAYTAGRLASHYDALITMKKRFTKGFSEYLPDGGKFPRDINDLKLRVEKGGDKEGLLAARSLHKYIQSQEGALKKDLVTRMWNGGLSTISDAFGIKTPESITKDPIALLKKIPYKFFIQGAPLRQLALNSMQAVPLAALTARYLANPVGLLYDTSTLRSLRGSSTSAKVAAMKKAKGAFVSKYTPEEWAKISDIFDESGLFEVISKHDNIDSSLESVKTSALVEFIDTPFRLGGKYGMELGEDINKSMTFMVALERYTSQKGLKINDLNSRDWAKISDDTIKLALNMNSKDKFDYQDGGISILMQYVNVFHKQMQMMFGGVGVLNKTERLKYSAGIFALFGGTGYGVYPMVEYFLPEDTDDTVREGIQHGLATVAFNDLAGYYTGEKETVALSGMSAANGNVQSVVGLVTDIVTLDTESLFEKSAPIMGLVNKGLKATDNVIRTLTLNSEQLSPLETTEIILTELGTMVSGLNSAYKGYMGATLLNDRNFGVDAQGNKIPELERALFTHLFEAATGVTSQQTVAYYELREKIFDVKKSAKELAKSYQSILAKVSKLKENDPERHLKMLSIMDTVMVKRSDPLFQKEFSSAMSRFYKSEDGRVAISNMVEWANSENEGLRKKTIGFLSASEEPWAKDVLQLINGEY